MPGTPGYCGSLTHAEVEAMARAGATQGEIAAAAGVAQPAVYYHLHRLGLTGKRGGDRQTPGWAERRIAAIAPPSPP
jgi:hypothetical protein